MANVSRKAWGLTSKYALWGLTLQPSKMCHIYGKVSSQLSSWITGLIQFNDSWILAKHFFINHRDICCHRQQKFFIVKIGFRFNCKPIQYLVTLYWSKLLIWPVNLANHRNSLIFINLFKNNSRCACWDQNYKMLWFIRPLAKNTPSFWHERSHFLICLSGYVCWTITLHQSRSCLFLAWCRILLALSWHRIRYLIHWFNAEKQTKLGVTNSFI